MFLNGPKEHDANTDSYGTAGRFIKALVAKGALIHNGERADKSRFWVAKDYLISEETLTDLARPEDAVPDDMAAKKGVQRGAIFSAIRPTGGSANALDEY